MSECDPREGQLFACCLMEPLIELESGHLSIRLPRFVSETFALRPGQRVMVEWGERGFQVQHWALPKTAVDQQVQQRLLPAPLAAGNEVKDEQAHSTTGHRDSDDFPGSEYGLVVVGEDVPVSVQPGGGFFSLDNSASQVPLLDGGTQATAPDSDTGSVIQPSIALKCAALQPGVAMLERRAGVPDEVYEDGFLEHPAVSGLMLSKDERLYSQLLEILDEDGVLRTETLNEKRFRIKWKRPIPEAETASKRNFVPMHMEIFGDDTKG